MKIIFIIAGFLLFISAALAEDQTIAFGYLLNTIAHNDMEPTLAKGDRIASDPTYYENKAIERGDIVLFHSPKNDGTLWVKRIIGLPGELAESKKGMVFVNGEILKESYVEEAYTKGISQALNKKYTVSTHHYYVLGDNRDNSMDSRLIGTINKQSIVAKVVSIYLSPNLLRIGELDGVKYP